MVERKRQICINESIKLSNKICYKCAYELDQCTKFVKKYKKSHEVTKPQANTSSVPCCFLCYESVDSDRIFDITKDNSVIFNPLRKIRNIFNDGIDKKNGESKLICLTCRYNLDVLYDLKRIYQETVINLRALIDEEISYSDFPKVHTEVVNRKTTVTTFPDITFYGTVNSDSDSNEQNMGRRGKQDAKKRGRPRGSVQSKSRGSKTKVRNCDECHNTVATGIDMYRFYHTGLTVCKNCWITMDPSGTKPQRRSRQVAQPNLETKLCAVFLKDVLSQELYKKKETHEMEKSKDDNTLDDNSQEKVKSPESNPVPESVSPKTRNHVVNGKERQAVKRKIDTSDQKSKSDVERTPSKVTRLRKERANSNEMKSTKALDDEPQSVGYVTRKGRKRILDERSTDSDSSPKRRETPRVKLNDRVNKPNRKKQKSNVEDPTTSNARSDASSDDTSNEDGMALRNRTRSATSTSTVSTRKEERSIRSRTRSSSISSTETTSTEFKSPKSRTQREVSEVKTEYVCDKCNKKFDTKLSNAKHRLTHLKQAAIKLEKLNVSSVKEKPEMELDSQDEKTPEEATTPSRPRRTVSVDKRTDDPSEDVSINVEDSDDEEIFSVSSKKNAKKKTVEEVSDKGGDATDKPDVAKSESRIEEESANDENAKITESEEYEKSTVVPDETAVPDKPIEIEDETAAPNEPIEIEDETAAPDKPIEIEDETKAVAPDETLEIEDDEDEQGKDTKNEPTTENKKKTSTNGDSDKSENEDAQETVVSVLENKNVNEEKDKNVNTENDTRVSPTEKENTISECNNDKDDNDKDETINLYDEAMLDDETNRSSPILSTRNTKNKKDHRASKNNLENNCTDKDEITDEPEVQCDLTDESSKMDTKESEENVQQILPIDETEIFSHKNDLDDLIIQNEDNIEEFEKRQSKFYEDEDNTEIETMVDCDKPNSVKDTVEPDISNGEKYDEVEDLGDDVAAGPVNNDDATCKKVTEETVPADDSTEEKKNMEDELKELENLVEENSMNSKYEIQENSTYIPDNSSVDAASEILKEVFELAAAEVQQREDSINNKILDEVEMETLENISREIRKSADMPSLDPISVMDIDDDNGITLN
ncbi:PREDICTED: protein PFC0760c-like isoform X2 [Wasmannia auropunctata]|uniref:protein PFC0760c-like isoform X2 n=1 Tax=Wasmannia auropunctata TaxID=64793 RepID=UPI0005EFE198|nr:PREDICTED: protein PFC0760c-like isoform X2 [Wasmannia auropunctata]